MVAAVSINAPQGNILAGVGATSANVNASQMRGLVAINFPSQALRSTEAIPLVAVRQTSVGMNATQGWVEVTFRQNAKINTTQGRILVAARGRVANPTIRAWTFTLDGHDFYVLRLGDSLTLVYDVYSEQWMDWQDFTNLFWRPNIGFNWVGATGLADVYGSTAICGDDTYGLLWFLDPDQPYDEHPDYLAAPQQLFFERIVMGQVPIVGRQVLPCYAAWLTTDMGDPAYDGAAVTLEISDDAGKTYDNMGAVEINLGTDKPEIAWYSLGQIEAPGRLFRISDDGAVARIDGMEMNDPDDEK